MSKEKNVCSKVKELMGSLSDVELKDKRGGKFWFRMYLTKSMKESPLEVLDLTPRPYNCLKRAGFQTVGEVVDAISSGKELKNVRNCGITSIQEIMERLFILQYSSLPKEKKDEYLLEVVVMNLKKKNETFAAV